MQNKNELKALSLKDEINARHKAYLQAGNEAINHAYYAGELLIQVKTLLKTAAQNKVEGIPPLRKWIEQFCDFNQRAAQGYMKLHKDLGKLSKAQRAALLTTPESIHALQKLLNKEKISAPITQTGTSQATIRREGERETTLSKCSPAFAEAIDSGKAKVTDQEIGELARLTPQKRHQAEEAIIKGKDPAHALGPHRPPVKALKGAEREAYVARGQIKIWHETIGRWLGKPPSIDDYRRRWPGPKGDRVVKLAVEFYEALKIWQKAIK